MQRPSLRTGGALAAAALITGARWRSAPGDGRGSPRRAGARRPDQHGRRLLAAFRARRPRHQRCLRVPGRECATRTVLAMTTNPAVNLFGGALRHERPLHHQRRHRRRCEAGHPLRLALHAERRRRPGLLVLRYSGANCPLPHERRKLVGFGSTGGSGRCRRHGTTPRSSPAVRSDPFFFDLTGFVGTVFGVGDRQPQGPRWQRQRLLRGAEHECRRDRGARSAQLGGDEHRRLGHDDRTGATASGSPATRWAVPRSTPSSTPAWSTATLARPRTPSTVPSRAGSGPPSMVSSGPTSSRP